MKRVLRSSCVTIPAIVFGFGAAKAQVVSSLQQDIELVVAAASRAEGFVVDPRLYSLPWVNRTIARDPSLFQPDLARDGEAQFIANPTQSTEHLARIVKLVGASGSVDDTRACKPVDPPICRGDGASGVLAFSPVTVRNDSAQIFVYRFRAQEPRRHPSGEIIKGSDVAVDVSYFVLRKTREAWIVAYRRTIET